MRHILEEYGRVTGLLVLVVVVIILLSSPDDIFLNITIIDTGLYYKTPNEIQVKSIIDFYNTSALKEFPRNIGNWGGVQHSSVEKKAIEAFKTDTVLMRKYYNGSRSIQFVLIKSENETILHKPEVCYSLAGKFNITGKGIESIKSVNWSGEFHANKFSAKKENITEVVMYWYMWDIGPKRSRDIKNSVVVMISTVVYRSDPDETYALETLKEFTSEIIPVMYKPRVKSEIIGKQLIDKFGIFGVVMEVLILGLSFVLIFYTRLSKYIMREKK